MRQLDRRIKIPIGILATIGLVFLPPIGLLVNSYILYLIFSKKGKMVFSQEYQKVVEETPHIRWQTTKVAWGLLILQLVFAIAAFAIRAFWSGR